MGEIFERIHMLLKHQELDGAETFTIDGYDGTPEAQRVLAKARDYEERKDNPASRFLERLERLGEFPGE